VGVTSDGAGDGATEGDGETVVAFDDGETLGGGDTLVSFLYEYSGIESSHLNTCLWRRFFFFWTTSSSTTSPLTMLSKEVARIKESKETRTICRIECIFRLHRSVKYCWAAFGERLRNRLEILYRWQLLNKSGDLIICLVVLDAVVIYRV